MKKCKVNDEMYKLGRLRRHQVCLYCQHNYFLIIAECSVDTFHFIHGAGHQALCLHKPGAPFRVVNSWLSKPKSPDNLIGLAPLVFASPCTPGSLVQY